MMLGNGFRTVEREFQGGVVQNKALSIYNKILVACLFTVMLGTVFRTRNNFTSHPFSYIVQQ